LSLGCVTRAPEQPIKFANYAHRDLAEFQFRFNRRFDLRSVLQRFVHADRLTKPHSLELIRG
jgi:hypothetical protein